MASVVIGQHALLCRAERTFGMRLALVLPGHIDRHGLISIGGLSARLSDCRVRPSPERATMTSSACGVAMPPG
jgi:hypothetical protein